MPRSSRLVCRDQRGLTLVELLIVLLVLGILLAIAVPSYLGMERRAHDAVARNDLVQARLAAHAYFVDSESFAQLSADVLHEYDGNVPDRITVADASDSSYCLETTVEGTVWSLRGPAADVAQAGCGGRAVFVVAPSEPVETVPAETTPADVAPEPPADEADAKDKKDKKAKDDSPGKSADAPGQADGKGKSK